MKAPLLFALGAAFLAGCVTPDREPLFLPAYEPFDPTSESWKHTRKLLLVSDCQLFNLYTDSVPERNLSSQTLIPTAIRSPQVNLFSGDVLRWIVAKEDPDIAGVLHLGDAADLACEGEFLEFQDIMTSAGRPWLMAPGNHDCFYFGNYHPDRIELWERACYASGEPLTKDRFVRLYLAGLLQQEQATNQALAAATGLEQDLALDTLQLAERLPTAFTWQASKGQPGLLDAIAWNIDEEFPWRSFVVQRARLDDPQGKSVPGKAILLDSCQYWEKPAMLPNAWSTYPLRHNPGMVGEMLADQLRVVRRWVEELEPERAGTVLLSHHPVSSYGAKTRASLRWLWSRNRGIAMFVTAHTHRGHFIHHFLGEREAIELNLGSTTDWPMEWRTLQAFMPADGSRGAYVRAERYTLADELRNQPGYFLPGWEIPFGALDDYRAFRQGDSTVSAITDIYLGYHLKPPIFGPARIRSRRGAEETELRYKDTLLGTYVRLVELFPTDTGRGKIAWPASCSSDEEVLGRIDDALAPGVPLHDKIDLLKQLADFEGSRTTEDPASGAPLDELRTRYKLSQAVWASRYGFMQGRTLQATDELIRARPRADVEP